MKWLNNSGFILDINHFTSGISDGKNSLKAGLFLQAGYAVVVLLRYLALESRFLLMVSMIFKKKYWNFPY